MLKASILSWSIPFNYSLVTRFNPIQDRASWVLLQYVPIMYLCFAAGPIATAPQRLAVALLAALSWQTFYEIGYIHNDVVTTKNEEQPTLRLNGDLLAYGSEKILALVGVRVACGLLLLAATSGLASFIQVPVNLPIFILVIAGTMLAFVVHNTVRGRKNMLTYALLSAGRYASIPLLVAPEGGVVLYALVSILMVPLIRTLEHACKPKYGQTWLQGLMEPFHRSRVAYYALVLGAYIVSAAALGAPMQLGAVFLYLLAYRTMVLMAIHRNMIRPTKHGSYRKRA